ncbi:Demethylrebeccamycin-D-glucose O-methyltransferase [Xylophilus ampelinus]|uniref:Methyltransferase type 11 domain-containing protein n=1 Tax=Variovorax paradoxus TaxID=34073 RepID=A0A2W5QN41_VARPD|nr:MAG: hypothetical protein DI563_00070 [Variovorax paradoxus]VTY30054.1 Demethylrebeccamycin-D-glucose O-methyltransferase [Xylophilus ampelinus]
MTGADVRSCSYVDLIALVSESNEPPGGIGSVARLVRHWPRSCRTGLDIGCNTGAVTLELASLADASVMGIDLSKPMIEAARARARRIATRNDVTFRVADARHLPVADESFDFVFSGGSTAFVDDRLQATREYARVIRPGGVLSELHFYYRTHPPDALMRDLRRILGFDIPAWGREDWLRLHEGLPFTSLHLIDEAAEPQHCPVAEYVGSLVANASLDREIEHIVRERLIECFEVFAENNKYLGVLGTVLLKRVGGPSLHLFRHAQREVS